ncbi:hypothetical protein HYW94_01055 [Candidatus Uhrbacteria bacterium]|nr:hypothetical protein [Candidatus Uhrbacteria bacterium]
METFLRHLLLFFAVVLAETLHISVFRYGHIVIALMVFFVFFLPSRTALTYACVAGFIEDIIAGPFGMHIVLYPLISLLGLLLCASFLTNKSFSAFFLLGIAGFFLYHVVGTSAGFFSAMMQQQSEAFRLFFSFEYAEELAIGFGIQSVFLIFFYIIQYRRVQFSRAFLMFPQ